MPIDAASARLNLPVEIAKSIVAKIPNWAAAPKKSIKGDDISGLKSIMAPTAMKIKTGKSSVAIPALYKIVKKPSSPTADDSGILEIIAPKPMGRRSEGSYCFSMAR